MRDEITISIARFATAAIAIGALALLAHRCAFEPGVENHQVSPDHIVEVSEMVPALPTLRVPVANPLSSWAALPTPTMERID